MEPDKDDAGPYRISKAEELPETYILTRTHCAGHWPWSRSVQSSVFKQACRETAQVRSIGIKSEIAMYHPSLHVEKVIHLWRHPWDNIVARFNHARRFVPMLNLVNYCRIMDGLVWHPSPSEMHTNSSATTQFTSDSRPLCWSEIDKYLQWHTNALHMEEGKSQPIMDILHIKYEDFAKNETLDQILEFLHLERLGNLVDPFVPNRTYLDQVSQRQMNAFLSYLKARASPTLWQKLTQYYHLEVS